jgi:hypothetical protein
MKRASPTHVGDAPMGFNVLARGIFRRLASAFGRSVTDDFGQRAVAAIGASWPRRGCCPRPLLVVEGADAVEVVASDGEGEEDGDLREANPSSTYPYVSEGPP